MIRKRQLQFAVVAWAIAAVLTIMSPGLATPAENVAAGNTANMRLDWERIESAKEILREAQRALCPRHVEVRERIRQELTQVRDMGGLSREQRRSAFRNLLAKYERQLREERLALAPCLRKHGLSLLRPSRSVTP